MAARKDSRNVICRWCVIGVHNRPGCACDCVCGDKYEPGEKARLEKIVAHFALARMASGKVDLIAQARIALDTMFSGESR